MKNVIKYLLFATLICCGQCFAQSKIEIEFKTGEDDLSVRDANVQGNLSITINYKTSKPPIVLQNANKNQSWPKNSIRRVAIPLPADVNLADLGSITLQRSTTNNNIDDVTADNWDMQTILVTASVKSEGKQAKYQLMSMAGDANKPLNRFKGGRNCNCLVSYNFNIAPTLISGTVGWIDKFAPQKNTSIVVELSTGGDDLRGGNDNARVRLKLKTKPNYFITINNINNSENLKNFTTKSFTIPIPNAQFAIDDIIAVELWHTGGGGMGADNWDVDKVKITIIVDGSTKILVDNVGQPLRRFTGDSRKWSTTVI